MRFHTHVGEHPAQDDLADPPFAQLKDEVVGLRAPHFVRAGDDGCRVLDERLELIEPVSTGCGEPVQTQRTNAGKGVGRQLI